MFNEFPYTNYEKINLDWLLDLGKKLKEDAESGAFDGERGPGIFGITTIYSENNQYYAVNPGGVTVGDFILGYSSAAGVNILYIMKVTSVTGNYVNGTSITRITGPHGEQGEPGAVTQAEFDELSEDVDELKSAISNLIADESIESDFVNDGNLTGSGIGAGIRWIVGNKIPSKAKIKKVGFTVPSSYTSNNTPLDIEIFESSNGLLTLVKPVAEVIPTTSAGQYVEISLDDYEVQNEAYVSFSQGRTMVTYTSGGNAIKYIRDTSSTSITESDLLTFNGKLNVTITIETSAQYQIGDPSAQIIHVGEGYQYSEIQDALENITDDSAEKPYTLIIHPKAEPYKRFSTLRKLSDPYPWSNAPVRYISLIGMDRYHCIIEDDTGDYNAPPAEILVNGLIANLTFKATHTNQNAAARQGAYAVHIDAEPVGNVGYEMQFENCSFHSDQTAGVGIGLHNACHLQFHNCEFISTASESYSPHSGYTNLAYLGAFNCHSSTNQNDTDQVLTLADCIVMANENKAYNFSTNANCYMTLRAYNNTFWCEGTAQANGYKGSYCTIYGANHGNNSTQLNAQ